MALRDQPYIPLYVMDFSTDEKLVNCSAESTGVLIRLMCMLHKMDEYGVLELKTKDKKTDDRIHNFAMKMVRQMPYDVPCIERSLRELIDEGVVTVDGDRLYQKRMVRDGDISKKRAEAGAKRGKSKEMEAPAKAEEEPQQKPSKTPAKTPSKESVVDKRFDEFWAAYPRKAGKGSAKKAWLKIAPTQELFQKIMGAVEAAKKCDQWRKDNGQYIPHPTTWLNQERWDDDYGPAGQNEQQGNFDPENPYADWSE